MRAYIRCCDLCAADEEITPATGTYTTNEGKTFDACDEHLEECQGYGFTINPLEQRGGSHGLF